MVLELIKTGILNNCKTILDPCCGKFRIGNILKQNGYNVDERDLIYGDDFLLNKNKENYDAIVMNPPFKLFNEFITNAKNKAKIICSIAPITYFGSYRRNINKLWEHLQYLYIFDRQIAYDKEEDDEYKVQTGMLVSGWFIFNMEYNGDPMIKILDMQKYIK